MAGVIHRAACITTTTTKLVYDVHGKGYELPATTSDYLP